jgi:thiol-disulfide isomerase/thioredoxin
MGFLRAPDTRRGSSPRRKVVRRGALAVLAATIVASALLAVRYSGDSAPNVVTLNIPVPEVNAANLIPGLPGISASDLNGPAVVLNFWASWCPSCQAEMPTLQAAHRELGNKVTFIGIDEEDSRPAAISFLRSVGVGYQNGFDSKGAMWEDFDLVGAPTTYFISHGRELDSHLGPLTNATLHAYIKRFFGVQ